MRATSTHDYNDYIRFLGSHPEEYDELMRDITINVTQFFRDEFVFKTVEEEILPLLIYDKVMKGRNIIRIWSAGCSSGEEPYSLAIIMRELLGDDVDNFHLTIMGTDIDEGSIQNALTGNYMPRQLASVPKPYIEKYFTFDGTNYQLSEEIMKMVEFKFLDLFKGSAGHNWDVIFCRNVVIYFTKEMQERLYMNFFNSLSEGGYFVMGNTESLVGDATKAFTQVKTRERIYQKRIAERGGSSPQSK